MTQRKNQCQGKPHTHAHTHTHTQSQLLIHSLYRSLQDVLRDKDQLQLFHEFLVAQGSRESEVQLMFWLAVEELRSTLSNPRVTQRKAERIGRSFFINTDAKRGWIFIPISQYTHTHTHASHTHASHSNLFLYFV